jgi:tRNA threonylcarbamoyladenosine biosynthesis protein TsaB
MSQIILALESGGAQASAALHMPGGRITYATAASGQSHSSELLPLARSLLSDQGLCWRDVQGYALGSGPGSFTGLRIACGLIQGLAFANQRRTIAISGFEAWAYAWWSQHRARGDITLELSFDARLAERFQARLALSTSAAGALRIDWLEAPQVCPADPTRDSTRNLKRAASHPANDDARATENDRVAGSTPDVVLQDPAPDQFGEEGVPLAVWVARVAADSTLCPAERWVSPDQLQPLYVRHKVALTTAERQTHPDLVWIRMTARDLASVMVIETQAYPFPWTSGNFQDSLAAGYELWVLKEHQVMVGYMVWMKVADEAHLLNFTLSPGRQGHGMGTWMLQSLIRQVQQAGLKKILLEVRPSNDRAIRLYRKFGFASIGIRKGYYPNSAAAVTDAASYPSSREDALVMAYELTPAIA